MLHANRHAASIYQSRVQALAERWGIGHRPGRVHRHTEFSPNSDAPALVGEEQSVGEAPDELWSINALDPDLWSIIFQFSAAGGYHAIQIAGRTCKGMRQGFKLVLPWLTFCLGEQLDASLEDNVRRERHRKHYTIQLHHLGKTAIPYVLDWLGPVSVARCLAATSLLHRFRGTPGLTEAAAALVRGLRWTFCIQTSLSTSEWACSRCAAVAP